MHSKQKKDNEDVIYGGSFPSITIKDMVGAQVKLIDTLINYCPEIEIFVVEYSNYSPTYVVQKNKIKDYCKYMEYDLVDVYEDRGISGMSIDKRNGYKSMLDYLMNNDIDGIVVYSLSRLGRKMSDVIGLLDVLKKNGKSF